MAKILLIDDKKDNLVSLSALLKMVIPGCIVLTASSGKEGVAMALSEPPDTILLDVIMPGQDGFEVCRRLKEDERTGHIPVILITAIRTDDESKARGLECGAEGFLFKPVEENLLAAQVRAALRIKQAEDWLRNQNEFLEKTVEERTNLLKESEERYRKLVEASPDGVALVGMDVSLSYASPKWMEIFGFQAEDRVIGRNFLDWMDPEDREMAIANMTRVFEGGSSPQTSYHFVRKDGTKFWGEINSALLTDSGGKPTGIMSIIRDITERKKAEEEVRRLNAELEQRVFERTTQLEAVNKELEGFSYSISHDLRTPLRHLTGFVNLLTKNIPEGLDEKSLHYLEVISNSALKMADLIDNILSFSRMGRTEMTRVRVNMDKILEEVLKLIRPDFQSREVTWTIDTLPEVQGDSSMLMIVITNLVSNAVKFTGRKPRAVIEIGCRSDQAQEEIIFVKDNGDGFDMEYKDKLFGLFQRLHHEDEFKGTGLGLANVRRIINRHGGRVWAEGVVGEGATFYFSLPKRKGSV